jgi:glycine cleavage system H protein
MPDLTRYSRDHEWVQVEGDIATLGITSYAAEQLGDVVYVELPEAGRSVKKGESVAVVESVKAASDVYSAVSGEVTESNTELPDNPQRVNEAPEAAGWFVKVRMSDRSELDALLDEDGYRSYVESL